MSPGATTLHRAALMLVVIAVVGMAMSSPAQALNPFRSLCRAAGMVSGLAGRACGFAERGGRLLSAGRQLASGRLGGAVSTALGDSPGLAQTATRAAGLAALVVWVTGGAADALRETGRLVQATTTPHLLAPWFSTVYWRMAGIALLLTLPFLFAAALQALIRTDLTLLARAGFVCLPLAVIGVALAAQLTTLLLAVTDELSGLMSRAAGDAGGQFLGRAAGAVGSLTLVRHSPFLAFFVCLFTVAGAVMLWLELFMREAAVYVIVLLLPLAFAALVWPARRLWTVRACELLLALILSKLAIIAVLTLGAEALDHSATATGMLTGLVLILLGVFSPWAMLRLVPVAELAGGVMAHLRHDAGAGAPAAGGALMAGASGHDWVAATTTQMHDDAAAAEATAGDPSRGAPPEPFGDPSPGVPPARAATSEPGREEASGQSDDSSAMPGGAEAASVDGRADTVAEGRPATGPGAPANTPPPAGRMPGMGPMWQTPDFSWRPLTLGLEDGWPPPPLWEGTSEADSFPSTPRAPERADGDAATGGSPGKEGKLPPRLPERDG